MNPLKPLFDFVRFIYDDFKTDIKAIILTVKRIKNEEPVWDPEKTQELKDYIKNWNLYDFLQEHWLFFLLIIFAFISGYYIATKRYQDVCNTWIIDNLIETGKCSTFTERLGQGFGFNITS